MPSTAPNTTSEPIYSEGANRLLAPFACHPENSRGRLHPDIGAEGRSVYQRDRDRIIHSTAFRRLEYKTQVFVYHEGDHYRTRLTHSLEVAQLSRSIAREFRLDEDLAEAVALAHDLGHTPFGHAGEEALQEVMEDFGGFDHNAQTLRILTKLESKYADFDGLNLTWECLEGVAKHNGPVTQNVPRAIQAYVKEHDLELDTYPNMEAQIASLCDDIAYNNHDIEDGLRAGLFTVESLHALPFVGNIFKEVQDKYPDLEHARLIHETKRRLIDNMVADVVSHTAQNLDKTTIQNVEDVRHLGRATVGFSDRMQHDIEAIKAFLYDQMYKHYKVNRMTSKARRVIRDLFGFFLKEPDCLPTEWYQKVEQGNRQQTAETVCDFIAGMTDRYAFEEHRRIFDTSYKLIGS